MSTKPTVTVTQTSYGCPEIIECRKDAGVVDEIPGAYKDLAHVIAAQEDLVEVVAKLDTILCVKG